MGTRTAQLSRRNCRGWFLPRGGYRGWHLRVDDQLADPRSSSTHRTCKTCQITKEFTIGEMPGGRSDTPMDLGTLTIQITSTTLDAAATWEVLYRAS